MFPRSSQEDDAVLVGRKAPPVFARLHFELPWLFFRSTMAVGFGIWVPYPAATSAAFFLGHLLELADRCFLLGSGVAPVVFFGRIVAETCSGVCTKGCLEQAFFPMPHIVLS